MAINQVTRHAFEVLAKAQVIVGLTCQGAEILANADLATVSDSLKVVRGGIEVLAKYPATISLTHQGGEVLADADELSPASNDALNVARGTFEVLAKSPTKVAMTSQGGEVLADADLAAGSGVFGLPRFAFEVLGRRFVPLSGFTVPTALLHYNHNWIEGVSLTSSYNTDVSKAATSIAEERRQLLDRPYRDLEVNWLIRDAENVDTFLVELRRYNQERMAVPLYMDTTELTQNAGIGQPYAYCDTTRRRFFPSGMVAVVEYGTEGAVGTVEYKQIREKLGNRLRFTSNFTNAFTAGRTAILPLVMVHEVLDMGFEEATEHTYIVKASFREVYGKTALPPVATDVPSNFYEYLGYPIFDVGPDWSNGIEVRFLREGSMQTSGRGEQVDARGDRQRRVHKLPFLEQRARAWDLISFFDSRRGRARAYWLIDYENVWDVLSFELGDTVLVIDPLGDFDSFVGEFDYAGITLSDGVSVVREAVTIEEVLGTWKITLDSALPSGYTAGDVQRFGRARLTRNRSDSLTEKWHSTNACSIDLETVELLEEKDVDLT
jgi:hypothetical protein